MAAAPLIEKTDFSTADPDVAREFLASAYGANGLRVKTPMAEGGVLSAQGVVSPLMSIADTASPAKLEVTYAGPDDQVFITAMVEGRSSIDHRGWNGEGVDDLGPGDVVVSIAPGTEWAHRVAPTRNTSVGLSEALLREVGGANPEDTSSHWDPLSTRPITGRAPLWHTVIDYAGQVLSDPVVANAPLVVRPLERLVAAAALTVFPNKLVGERQGLEHVGGPEVLRRAIAFIESNPHTDVSMADIAGAVHSTPRTLQAAFRKHLDTTPMAYLRRVRLHHLREELIAATPGADTTVAMLGLKWGFSNASRLAVYYRQEFNETPSDTLRRR